MAKRVVIIGAGIAGLSAGCYACMNGYDVETHEALRLPGGLCTAWRRQSYTIDGCVHWLTGTRPGSDMYRVWDELGAMRGAYYDHELLYSFVGQDGRTVHFYTDLDRLHDHLISLAPQDAAPIDEFCGLARRLGKLEIPVLKPGELMGLIDSFKLMFRYAPLMKDMRALEGVTLGDLGARFSDPLLQRAISLGFNEPQMPAMSLVSTLGLLADKAGGYPLGGSLALAHAIEERFRQLGGKVVYGSRVARVLERDGHAAGIELDDGSDLAADWVISACDLRYTLYALLGGEHIHPAHRELLSNGKRYPPSVLISFGVDMDFSSSPACLGTVHDLDQPLEIAGRMHEALGVHSFGHDPSLAPAGKSVVQCLLPSDWSYWESLQDDHEAYVAAKDAVQAICLELLERFYPGFASHVEVVDVATPLTFARYTGNWQGNYMTWHLSKEFQQRYHYIPKTVPGLDGFYTASMWTNAPGGLPSAALAGREVVQLLCHEDKTRFTTARP